MTKQEIKDYCIPLLGLNSLEDCTNVLDKFARFFMVVMKKHHYEDITTQPKADLKIILQMLLSKTIYIKQLLNGTGYSCEDYVTIPIIEGSFGRESYSLNRIIDPTIIATQVRSIFEMLCTFEIIYCIPDTDEKKDIIYYLFQIEGLRYQSRFYDGKTDPKIIQIRDDEQKQIDENVDFIKKTQTYKNLDPDKQAKLDKAMSGKDFRVNISATDVVVKIPWADIPKLFDLKHDLLENVYTHFSTYAHPSFISVRNYGTMFSVENPDFIEFAKLEITFCVTLLSVFIGDYMKIFPAVKDIYMSMPVEDQIILNFYNKLIRGETYSYSDAWKTLED